MNIWNNFHWILSFTLLFSLANLQAHDEELNRCSDKKDVLLWQGYTPHVMGRGEEKKKLKKNKNRKARRWVIERTMSWINRYRKILIRWEKKAENYEALLHFAFAIISFKASGVLG